MENSLVSILKISYFNGAYKTVIAKPYKNHSDQTNISSTWCQNEEIDKNMLQQLKSFFVKNNLISRQLIYSRCLQSLKCWTESCGKWFPLFLCIYQCQNYSLLYITIVQMKVSLFLSPAAKTLIHQDTQYIIMFYT